MRTLTPELAHWWRTQLAQLPEHQVPAIVQLLAQHYGKQILKVA